MVQNPTPTIDRIYSKKVRKILLQLQLLLLYLPTLMLFAI